MRARSAPASCRCCWRHDSRHGGSTRRASPWSAQDAFQLGGPRRQRRTVLVDGVADARSRCSGRPAARASPCWAITPPRRAGPPRALHVVADGARSTCSTTCARRCSTGRPSMSAPNDEAGDGSAVRAPIIGRVAKVFVAQGDTVAKGDRIAVVEAMKMEHVLHAPAPAASTRWRCARATRSRSAPSSPPWRRRDGWIGSAGPAMTVAKARSRTGIDPHLQEEGTWARSRTSASISPDMVATIEIRRPPHNFFDIELIRQIADACEALDKDDRLPRHRAGGAGHGLLRRRQARRRRRRAGRAGQEVGDRPGRPPLHRGGAPVPHGQADRRRHPRRSRRRRARPGAGARPARDLSGGALLRQLHPARLPSGLRPDAHAAGADRPVARRR